MKSSNKAYRIDYFYDSPLTLNGAESIHVYEICNHLQSLGCSVRLFSPSVEMARKPKFTFIPVKTPDFLISVLYQLVVILAVARQWSHSKPDVLYMRVSPILFVPLILSKLYKIPLYAEINGTLQPELSKTNTKLSRILLWLRITNTVEKLIYRHAVGIFTVTESLKTYLVKRFRIEPTKIIVVENGVDATKLKPRSISKHSQKIVFGYVGGLMWWQGLGYIIEAFQLAAHVLSQAELIIVGDGAEYEKLRKLADKTEAGSRIKLLGSIRHEKVAKTINSFDVCLAYYVRARAGLNSPFKVYEYLSCGKPVIVSGVKGLGDTFAKVAQVTEPENPDALAKAMIELAGNRKRRISMGVAARKYILDGHTWYDTASKLLDTMRITS